MSWNEWGISVADLENVIQTAVGGKAFTQMVEGEKFFDITLRWPYDLRNDVQSILDIPVDVTPSGTTSTPPSAYGSANALNVNNIAAAPRRRLGDLVTPLDRFGHPDSH